MTAPSAAGLPGSLAQYAQFLRAELAPFPGRWNLVLRTLIASAIAITAAMALQIPLLALSLIVIFFVTQSNVVITRGVAMLLLLGSTVAVAAALLVLSLTFGYPLLRIALASALFFCSVYLMRVTKISMVFFLVALVVIYTQTFVDLTDNAEQLVRSCLWVWVAVNYAVALALVINTLFLPQEPLPQLKQEMHRQLARVVASLSDLLQPGAHVETIAPQEVQRAAVALQKLLKFTSMRDPARAANDARGLACVTAISRLYRAASELPVPRHALSTAQGEGVQALRDSCLRLAAMLDSGAVFELGSGRPSLPGAALQEMQRALQAFSDFGDPIPPSPSRDMPAPAAMLVADAFSNPAYGRFALRTLGTTLLGYLFYNAVQWQGIHTIMLTCLIVALPNLGASQQHAMLRVSGALIGSALALCMVVLVIPHLDSIVGLLLMALPVLALGSWVSAGSERISYAGVQIMFTFSLALLEQFSPPSDVTEIRDRLVGILLGVGISILIQTSIWPEGEADSLRHKLAQMLLKISALSAVDIRLDAVPDQHALAERQSQTWAVLAECEAILTRVTLEPNWQEGEQERITTLGQTVLAQSRVILLASEAFQNELRLAWPVLDPDIRSAAQACQVAAEASLVRYAQGLDGKRPEAEQPSPLEMTPALSAYVRTAGGALGDLPLAVAAQALNDALLGLPDWRAAPRPLAVPTQQYV